MKDLHNNVDALTVVGPVAVGTTGTGVTPNIIDRKGYGSVEFVIGYGAITSVTATMTPVVKHGDTTGAMTSVADADLLGTEAGAGIAAANPRVDGASENVTKRIGYRGGKRYVSCQVIPTATAGMPLGIHALLGSPQVAPVAT